MMTIRWKHVLALIVILPIAGLLIGWSGLIGIRASSGHWVATDWFLHWVMRSSVRTAAITVQAPPLDNPALLPPAAGLFESGCATCHGSPAQARSSAVLGMLPPPPDLKGVVGSWTDEQLFEIVKHGVRYTGMPAWPVQTRDDEVWAMVAFLRRLPDMDAGQYTAMAGLVTGRQAAGMSAQAITCDSCHGEPRLGEDSLIPSLSGQSETYLMNSLRAYVQGRRPSGIMQQAVATIPEEQLRELAARYASQPRPERHAPADLSLVARGQDLAEKGRAADSIPACLSCHERDGGNAAYPRLSGQKKPYLETQLRLFREGVRGGSSYSHIMTEAAAHLEDEDVSALAAYFAGRENVGP
jgi:cytochrome c553